jgi:hypothetical protein
VLIGVEHILRFAEILDFQFGLTIHKRVLDANEGIRAFFPWHGLLGSGV